jgi:hypothetical protein
MIPIFRTKKNDNTNKYYIVAVVTGINMTIMYSNNALISGLLNITDSELQAKLSVLGAETTIEDISYFDDYERITNAIKELNNIYIANVTVDKNQEYEYQDFSNIVQQWKEKHIYVINQLIIYERKLYLCVQEHESSVFNDDLKNGKWLLSSFVGAGATTSVKVGKVAAGNEVSVVNSGTEADVVLDFVIPKGKDGASTYEIAVRNGYTGTEAEWIESLNTSPLRRFNSKYEFPNIGATAYLYIDLRENKLYRWDSNFKKYYCVGSNYNDITVIDGGNA